MYSVYKVLLEVMKYILLQIYIKNMKTENRLADGFVLLNVTDSFITIAHISLILLKITEACAYCIS